MSFKRKTDKALNRFGNFMGKTRENLREVERLPEHFVKGCAKGSVKGAAGATRFVGDVGTGGLKEMSGIVAHGMRELTGQKKPKCPYKSNLSKDWFE